MNQGIFGVRSLGEAGLPGLPALPAGLQTLVGGAQQTVCPTMADFCDATGKYADADYCALIKSLGGSLPPDVKQALNCLDGKVPPTPGPTPKTPPATPAAEEPAFWENPWVWAGGAAVLLVGGVIIYSATRKPRVAMATNRRRHRRMR